MKPPTLRRKFALWAAALAGVVLVTFAGGTFFNLYHEQLEAVDLEISVHRSQLQGLTPQAVRERSAEDLVGLEPWLVIAVFDEQGRVVRRSRDLTEVLARSAANENGHRTMREPDGKAWRLTSFRMENTTVVLGYALSEVRETVRSLLWAYAFSLPVVVFVAGAGGWWVAGRALAPVRELTAAAESIRPEHLDRRVPDFAGQDEIHRLAVVLNAMLARLEHAFRQTKRFAADASHELRTPLTIMNGEIERLLRSPDLRPGHEATLLSLQEEIGRLDRITEHLLLLTRFDGGSMVLAREPVDFSALAEAACEDAGLLAAALELEVSARLDPGVTVEGDAAHLRRVVLTLLDNATRYNVRHGRVQCVLTRPGGAVELRVGNTGPGIPPAARPQLFQRFFRVDPARQRGGHGLGLSLAREIVRAHGGDLALDPAARDGWTEFVVTLPASGAAPAVGVRPRPNGAPGDGGA